ncbi:MAG: Rpn family recombination-promoting nuclease/putative transposase [Synergistaceae bacterium]|jgi:hypothetical protein|nr:Rpn family recombination-promoting nuclease/putative transposase [Synergistaceae bacterium]
MIYEDRSGLAKKIDADVMSPLADPVVEEIYKDESVAGLAAESFIGAVLSECGEVFGTVVELTPQKRQTRLGNRGCYIDVLAKSDTNRIAAQEVQLYFDPSILQRNVLGASYQYISEARKGTTALEMAAEMPYISAINIFGHVNNCRKDNRELLQPIHFVYDKEPRDVALEQFAVFNVQLPYFPEAPANFSNPLYCWSRLLYEMHFNKKLPEEVYAMEPRMKEFVESDAGAAQFIARYGEAAASPAVRQAYEDWVLADFRERSMLKGARDEGIVEGEKRGEKRGESKRSFAIAKNAIDMKMSISQIEQLTGLTRAQIEELQR